VIALPRDVLMVFYTDGVTEHERDPIRGEAELVQAVQRAYGDPESDAASLIAEEVFRSGRGHDDAAVMALRIRRNPIDTGRFDEVRRGNTEPMELPGAS
jgi:serine phosphatase RsbU (regulator of sigma subunit)